MKLAYLTTGRAPREDLTPRLGTSDRYLVSMAVLTASLALLVVPIMGRIGYKFLILQGVCILTGFIVESGGARLTKRTLNYFGPASWIIFPFLVPPGLPLWMSLVGLALSLVITQTLFGGFGRHVVHPAVFAQLIVMLNFPMVFNASFLGNFRRPFSGFSIYSSTSLTSMTDFDLLAIGRRLPLRAMLTGPHVGFPGEIFPGLVIIAGLLYIILGDVNIRTPLAFLATMVLASMGGNILFPDKVLPAMQAVVGGSTLFFAFFIFTDHWTSTKTKGGRLAAGVMAAFITIIVRSFSPISEGIVFAAMFNYAFGSLYDTIALALRKKL